MAIFGNKYDDFKNIKIEEDDIELLQEKYKVPFYNISAKDGTNINEMFEYIIKNSLKNNKVLSYIGLPEDISFENIKIIDKGELDYGAYSKKNKKKKKK